MEDLKNAIEGALLRGPSGGLTSPQIHSVVPGSWEGVKAALGEMSSEGLVSQTNYTVPEDPYPRYVLVTR